MCSASSTGTSSTAVYVKWRRKKMRVMHVLASASPHRKFFDGKKWNCTAKSRYQQYTCKQIGCLNKLHCFEICVCFEVFYGAVVQNSTKIVKIRKKELEKGFLYQMYAALRRIAIYYCMMLVKKCFFFKS